VGHGWAEKEGLETILKMTGIMTISSCFKKKSEGETHWEALSC
jgi:hypothetical protein